MGEAADNIRECPACKAVTLHSYLFELNGCIIWRCSACGLGRTDVEGFNPNVYYTADYFCGKRSDGYADYSGAEFVLRRDFARNVRFIRRFRSAGRLLDIGCAYGFFLKEAQPFFDVSGIELAADAAEACRRAGLPVISGMADAASLSRLGRFDVITLFDVIEHLPDPGETLVLCSRQLAPGGLVVITTGDFGSLAARLMGFRWRLMTPPQHLWFFTRESLQRMGRAAGLWPVHFDHPTKIVPLSLMLFQLRRMLGMRALRSGGPDRIGLPINLFDAMRVILRRAS